MKLDAKEDHKTIQNDLILPLRATQGITLDTDDEKCHTVTVLDAMKRFINIQQLENEHLNL